MTPLALEMLIWFRTRAPAAGSFPNIERGPQKEIVDWFLREGVILQCEGVHAGFKTTERGDAWLKLCLDTPMPVQLWVDPRTKPAFNLERFMQDDSKLPA